MSFDCQYFGSNAMDGHAFIIRYVNRRSLASVSEDELSDESPRTVDFVN